MVWLKNKWDGYYNYSDAVIGSRTLTESSAVLFHVSDLKSA